MTIEELLECSAEQLEKMTDVELLKYFEPYLTVTRPDKAALRNAINKNTKSNMRKGMDRGAAIGRANKFAEQLGIDLGLDDED